MARMHQSNTRGKSCRGITYPKPIYVIEYKSGARFDVGRETPRKNLESVVAEAMARAEKRGFARSDFLRLKRVR